MTRAQASREEVRYAWRIFSVTSLGVALVGLNASTLTVALPVVSRHFSATPTEASWILLAYLLSTTAFIMVFGRLADMWGRPRMYLLGLTTFTAAVFACGLAPNATTLIVLRAIQGIGAAAIITNITALVTDAFPRKMLATGLGMNVAVISAFQVLGPIVGGGTATGLGWRWVFWFNVPVGVIATVWSVRVFRHYHGTIGRREPFDVAGAALAISALTCLVYAISQGSAKGWSEPDVVATLVAAAFAFPAFLWLQLHREHPLVDLGLFASHERAAAYLSTFILAVARYAVILVVSLYLQAALGVTAFQAGVRVTPMAFGMMIASTLASRLVRRWEARVLASFGAYASAACLAGLGFLLSNAADSPVLLVVLFLTGMSVGVFFTPNTTIIMGTVAAERRGIANGVRSALNNSGFVISTALALALMTAYLGPAEKQAVYAATLTQLPGHDLTAFATGCRTALLVMAALCVFAGVASTLRGRDHPRGQAPPLDGEVAASDSTLIE